MRKPLTPAFSVPSTSCGGTPTVLSSATSLPCSAWYTSAASSTERVSGPTLSSVHESG
jgi:hypothetical protein